MEDARPAEAAVRREQMMVSVEPPVQQQTWRPLPERFPARVRPGAVLAGRPPGPTLVKAGAGGCREERAGGRDPTVNRPVD